MTEKRAQLLIAEATPAARVRGMSDRTLARVHRVVGESVAWNASNPRRTIEPALATYWVAICDECAKRFGY